MSFLSRVANHLFIPCGTILRLDYTLLSFEDKKPMLVCACVWLLRVLSHEDLLVVSLTILS